MTVVTLKQEVDVFLVKPGSSQVFLFCSCPQKSLQTGSGRLYLLNTLFIYMKKALTSLSLLLAGVSTTFAQINVNTTGVSTAGRVDGSVLFNLLGIASKLIGDLTKVSVALIVLVFFWFLITFVWKGKDDAAKRGEAIKGMMWSIVAIFVMVAIWGLVGFLSNVLGIGVGGSVPVPSVPVLGQ